MTATQIETLGHGQDAPQAPETGQLAGKSPTQIALARLRHDKMAVFSATVVLLLVMMGLFAPLISAAFGVSTNIGNVVTMEKFGYPSIGPPFNGFTWSHPLGIAPATGNATDNLAFLVYGLRTSLFIAAASTVTTTIIGLVLGLVSGFSRGAADRVISFFVDLNLSFPFLLGALSIAPIITNRFAGNQKLLGTASFLTVLFVLTFFGWTYLTRLIRGQVFQLREREFVQAAQVMGASTRRILFKELLPNLVAPLVVSISLSLPAFVAAEAGLSYLGIGITGMPSLGNTIQIAVQYSQLYPLYLWVPVAAVAIFVLSLNLLGDSIRDAFDPQTRR